MPLAAVGGRPDSFNPTFHVRDLQPCHAAGVRLPLEFVAGAYIYKKVYACEWTLRGPADRYYLQSGVGSG